LKKFLLAPQIFVFSLFGLFLSPAQAALDLRVTTSPSNVSVGQSITYTITLSNTSPTQVQSVQVISTFPANTTIVGAANTYTPNGVATNTGQVVFTLSSLPAGVLAQMSVQLRPASSLRGDFANNVSAQALGIATVSTNVVVSVGLPRVDMAVGIEGFPTNVLIGDAFDYTVTVTNFGPSVASGVSVQSPLPTGMSFVGVTPAVPSTFNSTTRILTLNLGTLTNDFAQDVIVRLQANSAGTPSVMTSVVAADNLETAPGNDAVTNKLTVLEFVTDHVAVVSVTPQKLNFQNGLMEQLVTVTNLTTTNLTSVRLVVTNLASPNRLNNVSGTNNGNPYLMLPGTLGPSNTMNVLVQFVAPSRTPITANFIAVEGPQLTFLSVPRGTVVPITRVAHLRTAYDPAFPKRGYSSLYIEFASTAGKTYSLVYTTTADGSNWVAAQPPIVANSTHGRFIDGGPQVTGEGDRFYRVIEHQ
jgi:uncharacterized repeat protein (TIGR01451 family)